MSWRDAAAERHRKAARANKRSATPTAILRPAGEVRLDEQERGLVSTWRAFLAWRNEYTRPNPSSEDPTPEDRIDLVIAADGSGHIHIDPEDPNLEEFDAVTFYDLQTAPAKIEASRKLTELARIERDSIAPRRKTGDPRKGRKRARP